ncbi:hypothetical protein ACFWII_07565 [Streptomyces sp. NPDC127063]|uniref:hypothetical protein n=1 Tax=Streptomyces sp. NPDC127063 TaxID=3347123 RepID=UPI003668A7AB
MSSEALQRRAATGHRSAPRLAQELPAHLIVFDVLQVDGRELLHAPYAEHRAWTTAQEWLAASLTGPGRRPP